MSNSKTIDWTAVYERLRLDEEKLADVLSPTPERIRQVQAERAARLVSRRHAAEPELLTPLLIIEVAGERLALPLTAVSEVRPVSGLTSVPGAPDGVLGVVNLRGTLYSVMDTRFFLRSERLGGVVAWGVVLRHSVLHVILGAQAVLRIENIPASAMHAAEDHVLQVRDGIAILLDTRGILARLEEGLAASINSQDQQ